MGQRKQVKRTKSKTESSTPPVSSSIRSSPTTKTNDEPSTTSDSASSTAVAASPTGSTEEVQEGNVVHEQIPIQTEVKEEATIAVAPVNPPPKRRIDFMLSGIESTRYLSDDEVNYKSSDDEKEPEETKTACLHLMEELHSYDLSSTKSCLDAYIGEEPHPSESLPSIPRSKSLFFANNGQVASVLQAVPTTGVEVVEVVADQSWLLTKLAVQLLWAFRVSKKWMLMTLRLILFVVFLLLPFVKILYFWLFDTNVHKNIIYGLNRRNLLDIYTVPPTSSSSASSPHSTNKPIKHPVVVFVSGGAWIIGYKGWGALMGKVLSSFGIVVVTPDYRNFPQGVLPHMIDDVSMALQWIFENIHHFGGDPENVTLIGQSAGAHIASCVLLDQWEKSQFAASNPNASPSSSSINAPAASPCFSTSSRSSSSMYNTQPQWELKNIRSFIGISGPYNIEASLEVFDKHGFNKSIVERIMDYKIPYFSPALRFYAKSHTSKSHPQLMDEFPPVYLLHGTADKTVHWKASDQFADAVRSCGVDVTTKYYEGKTHTDPIIEDPICGDDFLLEDIMKILQKTSPKDENGQTIFQFGRFQPEKRYYPGLLVYAARTVNPF